MMTDTPTDAHTLNLFPTHHPGWDLPLILFRPRLGRDLSSCRLFSELSFRYRDLLSLLPPLLSPLPPLLLLLPPLLLLEPLPCLTVQTRASPLSDLHDLPLLELQKMLSLAGLEIGGAGAGVGRLVLLSFLDLEEDEEGESDLFLMSCR